ncbi:threonine synthase [Clostridia bacterium]|nr:threonine synthase [Clostridia bacterium]
MDIKYKSTRGGQAGLSSAQAVLQGLASDGGLFVPEVFPSLNHSLKEFSNMSYQKIAYEVLKLFFTDYSEKELKSCIQKAYSQKFSLESIVGLKQIEHTYYLELFHGPSLAFKDMALSILPYLMQVARKKQKVKKDMLILTATSGDTGKAAMEGFCNLENIQVIVFYPQNGVSPFQEHQMITQDGVNNHAVSVKGNFDDLQTGVKKIFNDLQFAEELKEQGYLLTSANSMNIGRLFPQIIYYVYALSRMITKTNLNEEEQVNLVVPTGNFGNILAAYYAKKIGLPIKYLICASNENHVLYDFFQSGVYDKNRKFLCTTSPSMDILVSSNLERLLYEIVDEDPKETKRLMDSLNNFGRYQVSAEAYEKLKDFFGFYTKESDNFMHMKKIYDRHHYILDPHTSIASCAYEQYQKRYTDLSKALIVSTASPYKFSETVIKALKPDRQDDLTKSQTGTEKDFAFIEQLQKISASSLPWGVEKLRYAPVLHHRSCEAAQMQQEIKNILKKKED